MGAKNIAIFASGRGSNAEKIIQYFEHRADVMVVLIISNKINAGIIALAKAKKIGSHIINKESFYESERIIKLLKSSDIDLIVLAGFLWLIPSYLISEYKDRIINIHPALLPKYGGKGMFGHHVHEAVWANNEKDSGITIHLINEQYDQGKHLFQMTCDIDNGDSPETIATKVLALEHFYFPQVIDQYLDTINKKWIN